VIVDYSYEAFATSSHLHELTHRVGDGVFVAQTDEQIAQMEAASEVGEENIALAESPGGCLQAVVAMPQTAVAVVDFELSK
jgi:hypothetical protein